MKEENQNKIISLCKAIKWGQKDIVKKYLKEGTDVNAEDFSKNTPLHYAAEEGDVEIVEWLLEDGANVDAKNHMGSSPLEKAIYSERLEVVECLIQHKVNIGIENEFGITPFHVAIVEGHINITDFLIKSGADINSKVWCGTTGDITPLHFAIMQRQPEIAKLLIKSGSNVLVKNCIKIESFLGESMQIIEGDIALCDVGNLILNDFKSCISLIPRSVLKQVERHFDEQVQKLSIKNDLNISRFEKYFGTLKEVIDIKEQKEIEEQQLIEKFSVGKFYIKKEFPFNDVNISPFNSHIYSQDDENEVESLFTIIGAEVE